MAFSTDHKIRWGFYSALIILLASCFLFFYAIENYQNKLIEKNKRVQIFNEENKILSVLLDMETVYRGYFLLGNIEPLDTYYEGKKRLSTIFEKLKSLHAKDSVQIKTIAVLDLSIIGEIALMQKGLDIFLQNGFVYSDTVKSSVLIAKQGMDNIRKHIAQMQLDQDEKIVQNSFADVGTGFVKFYIAGTFALCFFIILYCFNFYSKENKYRKAVAAETLSDKETLQQKMHALSGVNNDLAEQEGIEKFAATSRMARMIAHEVRNPLTNIGLANDQLKDVIDLNEESSMLLNMIKRNGERINILIGELLNATKFGELNCTNVSIHKLLDEVLVDLKNNIEQQHINVEKNYSPNICEIFVDAEKIKTVFYNVLLNGIESIKSLHGKVQITTLVLANNCVIIFKDNGCGIEDESLSKLFEPYFTSKNKGSGLGLTNAQNIVLNHKGKIKAESIQGESTIFTIQLPCS